MATRPIVNNLPPAPLPTDSIEDFDAKAFDHVAALDQFVGEVNDATEYVNSEANRANTRANASASSATASANSATRSDEWANKAPGSVVASGKYSARHYSDLSDKFANAPEDEEVEPGKFSALHWQEKAKKIANVHATTVATDPLPTVIATNVQEALQDLAYQADQLKIAKNQLKYGDGPYPVLDFQFAGAKYIDPRIEFTRASVDWDSQGREYEAGRPVLGKEGLRVSRARINRFIYSQDLTNPAWFRSRVQAVPKLEVNTPSGAVAFELLRDEDVTSYVYTRQEVNIEEGETYTSSMYIRFREDVEGGEEYHFFLSEVDFDVTTAGQRSVFTKGAEKGKLNTTGIGQYEYLEDGWYRVWVTAQSKNTKISNLVQIHAYGEGNLVAGPQFETGFLATPYIKTEARQVTVAHTSVKLENPLQQDCRTVMFSIDGSAVMRPQSNGFILVFTEDNSVRVQAYTGGAVRLAAGNTSGATLAPQDSYGIKGSFLLSWDGRNIHIYSEGVKIGTEESVRGFDTFKSDLSRWIINLDYIIFFQEYMTETQVAELYR